MIDIRVGDALDQLREMPPESVHCCVTSPPYWGLRDYGTGSWEGGDPACDHTTTRRGHGDHEKQASSAGTSRDRVTGGDCRKCGAVRIDHQIGLEETPDEWCARLVEVFREVKRVLRRDGTCWVNVGDSYNAYNGGAGPSSKLSKTQSAARPKLSTGFGLQCKSLKPKDLIGQPWLLVFALRADGWFLRDAIVWNKPNPMPESVKDRCTNAYEHVFLLAKDKRYFFDAEAIKETATNGTDLGLLRGRSFADGERVNWHAPSIQKRQANGVDSRTAGDGYRNCRNVWTIATEPFADAHFATFPTELARRCILAGCPVGGTVLDPFGGAGTTGLVADRLQRNAILIELNAEYAAMAQRRIDGDRGGLLDLMEANKPLESADIGTLY